MASEVAKRTRERVAVLVLIACGLLLGGVVLIYFLTRPPQMGTSEEVFRTVDALYTAVRMKDDAKVTDCERRLHAARDKGELPADAARSLDDIISTARGGGWDAATERLYQFMLAQRRDGASGHHEPAKPTKKK